MRIGPSNGFYRLGDFVQIIRLTGNRILLFQPRPATTLVAESAYSTRGTIDGRCNVVPQFPAYERDPKLRRVAEQTHIGELLNQAEAAEFEVFLAADKHSRLAQMGGMNNLAQ